MKLVFISDTHTKHRDLIIPDGDAVIFSGDLSTRGYIDEVKEFLDWLSELPHKHKIFIAGNHDFLFDNHKNIAKELIPDNVHYLEDSGIILDGIHFYGSPVTPYFHNWAFNRTSAKIIPHWDAIPEGVDVLITHGPPENILDKVVRGGANVGCPHLLEAVERIKPAIHVFGHIHEAYGVMKVNGTTFINASVLNERYLLVNEPVVFEI